MNIAAVIGDRIKNLMAEKGCKREDIAKELGITHLNTISYFVKGTRKPNVCQLIIIANYFNVSIDYLLGRADVKTTDINVRSICEYLHITEECVHQLHTNKENYLNSIVDDFSNKLKSMF